MEGKGTLYLKPVYGLANRLRTVAAALALCRKSGMRLCVCWFDTHDCHVRWRDILEVPVEFDVVEIDPTLSAPEVSLFTATNANYYPNSAARELVNRCMSKNAGNLAHENFKPFYRGGDYKWLVPTAEISQELSALRVQIGEKPIGVHIRRTDNREAIFSSPTSLFKDSIAAEIAGNPSVRFFLATDDSHEKEDLRRTFPSKIFTRDKIVGRFENGGIRDALIDLLLLASCRKIYGTFWSSFSREASNIGGGELVVLSDDSRVAASVIVNLEQSGTSLMRCLDSLLKQWLFRIEIICVDGCASAPMKAIVSEYIAKDKRITRAKDVSEAMRVAIGKYLVSMSSNEVAEYNMTKLLFEFAEAHTLKAVFFKANRYFGGDYDADLVDRLNGLLDADFPWRVFHRKVFAGHQTRWLLDSECGGDVGLCNVFVSAELAQASGGLRPKGSDLPDDVHTGLLAASFLRRPVWSGNRDRLLRVAQNAGSFVTRSMRATIMRAGLKLRNGLGLSTNRSE